MDTVKEKKNKGGRPPVAEKKELVIRVRLSRAEYLIVEHNAQLAGLNKCAYLRQMGVTGIVKVRLTGEERQYMRKLIGMSTNLNQMVKLCHKEGVLSGVYYYENIRNEIDELIKKLRG